MECWQLWEFFWVIWETFQRSQPVVSTYNNFTLIENIKLNIFSYDLIGSILCKLNIYKKFFQKEMFWSFDMPALTLFPGSIFFLVLLERFRMNSPSLPPRRNLEVTVSSVTSIFPLLKKIPYFLKKCRNSVSEISQFWRLGSPRSRCWFLLRSLWASRCLPSCYVLTRRRKKENEPSHTVLLGR